MNPSSMLLLFSLLLPSLLHSKSQGIRLDEGFSKDTQLKHQVHNNSGGCDDDDDEANLCNRVQNYGSRAGSIKGDREGEETKVNWVATSSKHHEEVADMAEMDYTAATRKPPIHN